MTESTIPQQVLDQRTVLYQVCYDVAMGKQVKEALLAHDIAKPTYYRWCELYPGWVNEVRQQAQSDALNTAREAALALQAAKVQAQAEIDQMILEKMPKQVKALLDKLDGDVSISALRETLAFLGQAVREGLIAAPVQEQPVPPPASVLPSNVDLMKAKRVSIMLQDGTEVEISRPDMIDGEVTVSPR